MILKSSHTAVLIFSRVAEEEARAKKYLSIGRKKGKKIAAQLIQDTINKSFKSGLKVFTSFSNNQTGDCFGERLANSMEVVFKKGFDQLVVIGTDSPSVTPGQLRSAADSISESTIVLAPTPSGGIYLIGLHRNNFNREAFLKISWLSNNVFTELHNKYEANSLKIEVISQEADIDSFSQLCTWQQDNSSHTLAKIIKRLIDLHNSVGKCVFVYRYAQVSYLLRSSLKSPPARFFSPLS